MFTKQHSIAIRNTPILILAVLLAYLGISNTGMAQSKEFKPSLVDTIDMMNRAKKYGLKPMSKDTIPNRRNDSLKIRELIIGRWNKNDAFRVSEVLDSAGINTMLTDTDTDSATLDQAVYALAEKERKFLMQNNIYIPTNIPAYNMLHDSLDAFNPNSLISIEKLQKIHSYSTLQALYLEMERFIH